MGLISDSLTITQNAEIPINSVILNSDGIIKHSNDYKISTIVPNFNDQDMFNFMINHIVSSISFLTFTTTYGENWTIISYISKSVNSTSFYGILNRYICNGIDMFCNVYDWKISLSVKYINAIEQQCVLYDYKTHDISTGKYIWQDYFKSQRYGFILSVPCRTTRYTYVLKENNVIVTATDVTEDRITNFDVYPKGNIFVPKGKDRLSVVPSYIRAYIDAYDNP